MSNPDNPEFETKGGNDTVDKVFCLSFEEAETLMTESLRKASINWWLRSPGLDASCVIDVGGATGTVYHRGFRVDLENGVRPALWINLFK